MPDPMPLKYWDIYLGSGPAACDDTTGMLLAEDFTTGSLPSGWTEAAGTLTYNESPALRGDYSAKSTGGVVMAWKSFTGQTEAYFHFLHKATVNTSESYTIWLRTSVGDDIANITVVVSGTDLAYNGIFGTANASAAVTLTTGTVYHIWGYIKKGATDGILTVWGGTTVNKGDATQIYSITTGSVNLDIGGFGIGTTGSNTSLFDQIRVKATDFTSVCP